MLVSGRVFIFMASAWSSCTLISRVKPQMDDPSLFNVFPPRIETPRNENPGLISLIASFIEGKMGNGWGGERNFTSCMALTLPPVVVEHEILDSKRGLKSNMDGNRKS